MKKSHLFAFAVTSIVCSGIVAAFTVSLAYTNPSLELKAGSGITHTHIVNFNTIYNTQYDSEKYAYSFYLENTIKDSDGNDRAIRTASDFDFNYFTAPDSGVEFNKTVEIEGKDEKCLAYFVSQGWEEFCVGFNIVEKATLDLNSSVISYYVNGAYANAKFENYGESIEKEGHNLYVASFDLYNGFGNTIAIKEVKLKFTCEW